MGHLSLGGGESADSPAPAGYACQGLRHCLGP